MLQRSPPERFYCSSFHPKIFQAIPSNINVILLVQFIRDGKVGHIIIDEETMIRGVAELFRILFPALDDFPGNLEDSALALILGSKHPESFIRLNLTTAEAGDFLGTAFSSLILASIIIGE